MLHFPLRVSVPWTSPRAAVPHADASARTLSVKLPVLPLPYVVASTVYVPAGSALTIRELRSELLTSSFLASTEPLLPAPLSRSMYVSTDEVRSIVASDSSLTVKL